MHLADKSVKFMGTSAIVGNSIPVGVGLGLAAQLEGKGQVSFIFLGDGAVEEGVFYESVNFAVVKQLPVIFLCENNNFSVYSDLSVRQPKGRKIFEMVMAMGIDSHCSDGLEIFESYDLFQRVFNKVRSTSLPSFIEVNTYRWREHCGPNFDDVLGYRSDDEVQYWMQNDPLNVLEQELKMEGKYWSEKIIAAQQEFELEIAMAFDYAENSPWPDPIEDSSEVYAVLR